MHRYWRMEEVLEKLAVEREFVQLLEVEEIIHPKVSLEGELVLSHEDVERIRLARVLVQELEVNLPGVEVILHLREELLAMQRQFGEILQQLICELRSHVRQG